MSAAEEYTLPDKAPAPPRADHGTDSDLDKSLPHSLEAERVLLGAVLVSPASFNEIAEALRADDFFLDAHRRIYAAMEELTEANVALDLVTLSEELSRKKHLDVIGGRAYVASLTEGIPRRLALNDWIATVRDKSRLRQLIAICSTAITRAADQSESTQPILESVEAELLEIAQESNAGKLRTICESVQDVGGVEPYIKAMTEPAQKLGLATGFTDYDRMTGGLQRSELTIIAARPSMGKTALAINIAQNASLRNGKVVAVFSLEMSRQALERRMMAGEARVDVRRALIGEWLSQTERDKMFMALAELIEAPLYIDDTATLTPTQLRAKARRLKQRVGALDLVVIDYLQLMTGAGRHANRQEEIASVSRALKACAKELEIPVVALAQLSRNPEQRTDKRPILSDLRESGQIEQDADVVAFIHREAYYKPDDEDARGLADLIIAKQRQGPTGTVNLAYMSEFTQFGNLYRG